MSKEIEAFNRQEILIKYAKNENYEKFWNDVVDD